VESCGDHVRANETGLSRGGAIAEIEEFCGIRSDLESRLPFFGFIENDSREKGVFKFDLSGGSLKKKTLSLVEGFPTGDFEEPF